MTRRPQAATSSSPKCGSGGPIETPPADPSVVAIGSGHAGWRILRPSHIRQHVGRPIFKPVSNSACPCAHDVVISLIAVNRVNSTKASEN
jgi:hypothetical protein